MATWKFSTPRKSSSTSRTCSPNRHYGRRDQQRGARARLLELKSDEVYFPHIIRLMGLQSSSQDPTATAARRAAARYYEEIDGLLADREFLTRTYSFADIAFYMAQLFGARMGAPMTDATPNLLRWRDRMTARPAVRSVVGWGAGSRHRRPS